MRRLAPASLLSLLGLCLALGCPPPRSWLYAVRARTI